MPPKRPLSPGSQPSDTNTPPIFRSHPITDRASKFIATFTPSPSPSSSTLQSDPTFSNATHRILAWRYPSSQRSLTPGRPVYSTGHDDDGEQHAGRKLESLLKMLNVVGTVCVARWYGGIMLGPVRFTHIENCARQAIGIASGGGQVSDQDAKRQKTASRNVEGSATAPVLGNAIVTKPAELARRKADLVTVLKQRDESIMALRGLLAEKQGREVVESTRKVSEYANMPVVVLEKLEKARDATIAWVLKELDKVEEGEAAMGAQGAKGDVEGEVRVEGEVENGEKANEVTNDAGESNQAAHHLGEKATAELVADAEAQDLRASKDVVAAGDEAKSLAS